MRKLLLCLLIAIIGPLGGLTAIACAQSGNPLRVGQQTNHDSIPASTATSHQLQAQRTQRPDAEMSEEVRQAIYEPRRDKNTASPNQARLSTDSRGSTQTILDPNVSQSIHVSEPARNSSLPNASIPKSDLDGIHHMLDALQTKQREQPQSSRPSETGPINRDAEPAVSNLEQPARLHPAKGFGSPSAEATHSDPRFNQPRFQKLLQQIAINTFIVMCVGVGFILIAKQWYFKRAKPAQKTAENTIQITSTLRLSPKANLFLVAAGTHRLIVASDQNGINSVVPLTDSFASTLDTFADIAEDAKSTDLPAAGGESLAGLYSLASVGKVTSKGAFKTNENDDESMAETRRKMEAALDEHGLKELFVQTMRSQN